MLWTSARRDQPDGAAAARVAALLGTPADAPRDEPAGGAGVREEAGPAGEEPAGEVPGAPAAAGEVAGGRLLRPVPGADAPGADLPGADVPVGDVPASGVPGDGGPAGGVPGGGPARSRRERLPAALAGGRVDPGRRGVAALVLLAVVAAAVAAVVGWRGRPQEVAVPAVEVAGQPLPGTSAAATPGAGGEVVVAVAGTVASPGVVTLPAGSRVHDAVEAAGGLLPGASYGLLNLARRLVDGEQVLVGIEPPPGAAPAAAGGAGGLVDLNAATVADLDALPGIGPVLAQRIVDWRTENGRFASVDQLREVTGIGESKFQDLRDKVAVG